MGIIAASRLRDSVQYSFFGDIQPHNMQKFQGGGLWTDGKIYFCPFDSNSILVLDPQTKDISFIALSSSTYNLRNTGFCLAPNGKFYSTAAFEGSKIFVFDPSSQETTTLAPSADGYIGQNLGVDGHIYFIPYKDNKVQELNPTTGEVSYFGFVSDGYYGGVLAHNDKIYSFPRLGNSHKVLEIDTVNKSVRFLGDTGGQLFAGVCLSLNENIYGISFNGSQIWEFNPSTEEMNFISQHSGIYIGATLAYNGNIIFIPSGNSEGILEFDPITKNVKSSSPLPDSGNYDWYSSTISPDTSNLYQAPRRGSNMIEVSPKKELDLVGTDKNIPSNLSDLPTSNYNRYYNRY
jgi:streptogramin lyase